MPELDIHGIDVSKYACENSQPEIKPFIQVANANNTAATVIPARMCDAVLTLSHHATQGCYVIQTIAY